MSHEAMPERIAYKIMTPTQLEQMRRDGRFAGAPADIADGYIHLSCGSQLAATWDKHFGGVDGLMLAAVDLSRLGDAVRWEPSRGGQPFPTHLWRIDNGCPGRRRATGTNPGRGGEIACLKSGSDPERNEQDTARAARLSTCPVRFVTERHRHCPGGSHGTVRISQRRPRPRRRVDDRPMD
jgi:uncharacterized protein (DUF952 family)